MISQMPTQLVLLVLLVAAASAAPQLVHGRHHDDNDFAYGDSEADRLDIGGPPTDHARVARDIVHKAEWTAFGTNSARELPGFPMVNIISVADSKRGAASTGNVFFLLTNLDFTGQDLQKSNNLTMLFSQEQNLECSKQRIDPMEPTCARVIIAGQAYCYPDRTTAEYQFGYAAFVDRHPAASNWVAEHDFYLCKAAIEKVIVLDWYGGPHHVPVADYFDAKYNVVDVLGANSEQSESSQQHRVSHYGGLRFPSSPVSADKESVRQSKSTSSVSGKKIVIHLDQATNDLVIDM